MQKAVSKRVACFPSPHPPSPFGYFAGTFGGVGEGSQVDCCIIHAEPSTRKHKQETDMQTKITLDDELIKRAQKLTGIKTKSEAVQEALRALISLHEQVESSNERPQQAVIKSVERSLIENAELWSELAKH